MKPGNGPDGFRVRGNSVQRSFVEPSPWKVRLTSQGALPGKKGGGIHELNNVTGFCSEINELRKTLTPFSDVILRCYKQGLTVTQCAVFLHATMPGIANLSIAAISTPACESALREILWSRVAEDPHALLKLVPGLPRSPESSTKQMLNFLLEEHPSIFSWIPMAYRHGAESELGFQLDDSTSRHSGKG